MNTDLSEKLQKTIENTELVANEVHATCEAVSKNNDTNLKINSNMSTISENLRKHVRSVSIMNENVSKPDVRKPLIETSNRFEPLSFLNDENQNESQYDDPVLFQKKLRTNRNQSNRNPQPPLFIL